MSRMVRVSLVNSPRLPESEPERLTKTLRLMEYMVDQAASRSSLLVAFPECCNYRGVSNLFDCAESLDGQTIQRMAAKAQQHRIYIVCPMITLEGGRRFNSAVLIGSNGTVVGVYHKNFPTPGELNLDIMPGTDTPVFVLTFGRVGLSLCFDLEFREVGDGLHANDAELVLWSSMYNGGRMLQKWGLEYGFSIGACFEHHSTFVDGAGRKIVSMGRELHDFSRGVPPLVTADLDLDQRVIHHYENVDKLDNILRAYGPNSLQVEWLYDEALLVITSQVEDKSTDQLIREFGLETRRDLLSRARMSRTLALEGRYVAGAERGRDWTLAVYPSP